MAATQKHTSDSVEHYSPLSIVDPGRRTMGGIDLDPASCAIANTLVRARRYYTQDDDALALPRWCGSRVFLNPPGGLLDGELQPVHRKTPKRRPCTETGSCGQPPGHTHEGPFRSSATVWWYRMMRERAEGNIEQGIFVGFTMEILQVAQVDIGRGNLPIPTDMPLCIPSTRVAYMKETTDEHGRRVLVEGASPPGASFIAYVPPLGRTDNVKQLEFAGEYAALGAVLLP